MSQKVAQKSAKKSDSKQRPQWNQCNNCSLLILKLTNEEHECNLKYDKLIASNQPFLYSNMSGLRFVDNFKDIVKDLQIGKEYIFDFGFMSPTTMKLLNLDMGDCIIVSYVENLSQKEDMKALVLTCWPSTQLEVSQISFNKYYTALNGLIFDDTKLALVRKLDKTTVLTWKQVNLEFMPCLSDSSLFTPSKSDNDDDIENDLDLVASFLKEIHTNKHILNKQMVYVHYMGQNLVFKINTIDKEPRSRTKNNIDSITNKLNESLRLDHNENKVNEVKSFTESDLRPIKYEVMISNDDDYGLITAKTSINIIRNQGMLELNKVENEECKKDGFKQIGGLEKEIELLKEFFISPFEFGDMYKQIGIELSKGVLLHGPGGCGKTLLARATCNESKCNFIELKISDIYSRNYGESESKLKSYFNEAWQRSPCIMFIDEIDTLCGRRETLNQDLEKRIVSLFSNLMDQSKSKNILFLCTTNKIDSIDVSLRRPGRLDKEIEIPIPNQTARYHIIKKQLDQLTHKVSESELLEVAQNCHGYVGADLEMLVQESGLVCVKRLIKQNANSDSDSKICVGDLITGLKKIKPSAMREITFDIPKVYWSQIGGQAELKKKLHQAIIWPIKYAESFKRLNIKPPRGLLMYGPPGCSKTMIAKALATETGLNFIAVKGPELFSKWVGESEKTVREIFRKARNAAPAIIFFDEIDAVAMERSSSANKSNNVGDRVLAQLLNEMDGVENLNDVTIVAATNRPDMIDKALMRPGRLDRIVYVKLPDRETRKEIFELKIKQIPVCNDVCVERLVDKSEKYSGAEIAAVCNEAAFMALESDINCTHVSMEHFELALKIVTPRTSDATIKYFDNFSFNSEMHQI